MLNIAVSITPYLPLVAKQASVLHGSVLDASPNTQSFLGFLMPRKYGKNDGFNSHQTASKISPKQLMSGFSKWGEGKGGNVVKPVKLDSPRPREKFIRGLYERHQTTDLKVKFGL